MKKLLVLATILAALAAPALLAQTDNTVIVARFPGANVGLKVAAAQATCGTNAVVACLLQLDPSLAAWPAGTMPTLCSHCYLVDYRGGEPWLIPGLTSNGANGTNVAGTGSFGNILKRTE